MNKKTAALLEQHFDTAFAAPNGIKKLRELILALAVQGKLVPQDSENGETPKILLKEIAKKIGSGSTPSGGKAAYQNAGVPLIRSMNIHFDGFREEGLAFIDEIQADKLRNVTVEVDDVLLNITGASIGRVAIAPSEMDGARVNQHVCIIRPTERLDPRYLKFFLASPQMQSWISNNQIGATREALTKSMIEQLLIPLPSLEVQYLNIEKVNYLMGFCDELEELKGALCVKQNELLEAIMAQI